MTKTKRPADARAEAVANLETALECVCQAQPVLGANHEVLAALLRAEIGICDALNAARSGPVDA